MIFVINNLKYDTTKMELISIKCEYKYTGTMLNMTLRYSGKNVQILCDVWEKVKEVMRKFAERLRELFGSLSKVVEPGKPIKATDYRCHRDFYVRAEYTYIPIFRRNMPYHRRNF